MEERWRRGEKRSDERRDERREEKRDERRGKSEQREDGRGREPASNLFTLLSSPWAQYPLDRALSPLSLSHTHTSHTPHTHFTHFPCGFTLLL